MSFVRPLLLCLCIGLPTVSFAQDVPPKIEAIRGHVYFDQNDNGKLDDSDPGLVGVDITDGVHFVTTDEAGAFEIIVRDDPVIPYQPSRTVAMSWPTETWPVGAWYHRFSELKPGQEVTFLLRKDQQKLPFAIVHGTDPHDMFTRDFNFLWRSDVARMTDLVKLCVITGDLGYMGPDNADKDLATVAKFTRDFPVPMFHTPGNHDVVGIHQLSWAKDDPLYGNGAFTKHIGPVRWSFTYAGVHLVGLDWARIVDNKLEVGLPDIAHDWLELDLKRQKSGTRSILFAHQPWSPQERFWDIAAKYNVKLMLGGHSHRNMDMTHRGIPAFTTMSLSKLAHVYADKIELVDFCQGYRPQTPEYHARHCFLKVHDSIAKRHGRHVAIKDKQIFQETVPVGNFESDNFELSFVINPETAESFGVRLEPVAGKPIEIAVAGNHLHCMGVTTTAGRRDSDKDVTIHALFDLGKFQVRVNGRVFYEKDLKRGMKYRPALFANKGSITIQQGDAWEVKTDDAKPLNDMAWNFLYIRQPERALPYYKEAVRIHPKDVTANFYIGRTLFEDGKREESETYFQKVVDEDPKHVEALEKLGILFADSKRYLQAVDCYEAVLKQQPERNDTKVYLAWMLAVAQDDKVRDGRRALSLTLQACAATKNQKPFYLEAKAAALACVGKFDEAIVTVRQAIVLARAQGDGAMATRFESRIPLFEKKLTIHEAEK